MQFFKTRLTILTCCLLLMGVVIVSAATDCPALVQYALKTIDDACSNTGRNQACYGNIKLLAEPQAGMDRLPFRQKGDRVNLSDVKSLKLSAMDAASNTWGVAMLKVQANLPDTLPGQNVTFLLFGDVSLDNAQTPTTSSASSKFVYGPMQAFYFRTGSHDAPCEQAPSSGILLQSPTEAKVQLRINEVDITLGSTVYLQLTNATEMSVSVVEGQATLTAFGKTVIAPAGTRVRIAVDATTSAATAAPSDAEPNVAADLANLPLQHLPLVIGTATATVQPTATVTPVSTQPATASALTSDFLLDGAWHDVTWFDCPGYPLLVSEFNHPNVKWKFSADGSQFGDDPTQPPQKRVAPGVYVATTSFGNGATVTSTYYIHSSTDMTLHMTRTDGCIWDITFTYMGPAATAILPLSGAWQVYSIGCNPDGSGVKQVYNVPDLQFSFEDSGNLLVITVSGTRYIYKRTPNPTNSTEYYVSTEPEQPLPHMKATAKANLFVISNNYVQLNTVGQSDCGWTTDLNYGS